MEKNLLTKKPKLTYCKDTCVINIDLYEDEDIWNYRKYFIVDESKKINVVCKLYYESEDYASFGYICEDYSDIIILINLMEKNLKNRLIFS